MRRKSFYVRLRELPKELGIEWSELAHRVRRSPGDLARLLNPDNKTSLNIVHDIGQKLGLFPVGFFDEDGMAVALDAARSYRSNRRIPMYVRDVIAEYVTSQGIDDREAAKRMGIGFRKYAYYKRASCSPSVPVLDGMCGNIGWKTAYLLRDFPPNRDL